MRITSICYLLLLFFVGIKCKKPDFRLLTKSTINSIDEVGPNMLSFTATIVDLSSAEHEKVGICYSSVNSEPNLHSDLNQEFQINKKGESKKYEISGLKGNTLYYIRFFIMDDGLPIYSETKEFKTQIYPKAIVNNSASTNLSYTSVKINGRVNCFAMSSKIELELMLGGQLETFETIPSKLDKDELASISLALKGLKEGTKYNYRIVVKNEGGIFYSKDTSFTTKKYEAPSITALAPSILGSTYATLMARVNAKDQLSTFKFEFGNSINYGTIIPASPASVVGESDVSITADVSKLISGQTYHYRVIGENATGQTIGRDFEFKALALLLTAPKKNQVWRAGFDQKITYESNFSDSLKIDLYKKGSFIASIVPKVLNFGSFTWKVPSNIQASNEYVLRITNINLPSFFVESDLFTITEVPKVSVIEPQMARIWTMGTLQDIKWESNYNEKMNIDLFHYGDFDQKIASNVDGNGTYKWNIPKTLKETGYYTIKLAYAANPNFYVFSKDFDIASQPFIRIESPVLNANLEMKTNCLLSWNDNVNDNIKIELLKNGVFVETIESSIQNKGTYNWTLPNKLKVGADYSIRISSFTHPEIFDISKPFTINLAKFISIKQPLATSDWQANTMHIIEWDDNLDLDVKIDLLNQDGTVNNTVNASTISNGSYEWLIPKEIKTGKFALQISSTERPNLLVISPYFTINEADFIDISLPTVESNWDVASLEKITWTDNINGNVKIELFSGDNFNQLISASSMSNGIFLWTIPQKLDFRSDYHIKITSLDNALLFANSPDFTIRPPFIQINQPILNQEWISERSQTIKWICNLIEDVKIDLYKGGMFLKTIVNSTNSNNSFSFTPSADLLFDNNYSIRITSTTDSHLFVSSRLFSIVKPEPSAFATPANRINQTSVTVNGIVNPNNYETKVWFEYGLTNAYDQITDAIPNTLIGTKTNNVMANIEGLQASTTYHFRVKASNQFGTNLSDDLTFKTIDVTQIVDADFNVYNTIAIGAQLWMKENLKTTHYNDGSSIIKGVESEDYTLTEAPKYYFNPKNNESKAKDLGRFYTWYVATDARTVCPIGWRIPTNMDIEALLPSIGDVSIAGGTLKEIGISHWGNPNEGANNTSQFTAKGSGYHDLGGGTFGENNYTYFWTSSSRDLNNAQTIGLIYTQSTLFRDPFNKKYGFSVRCIKE